MKFKCPRAKRKMAVGPANFLDDVLALPESEQKAFVDTNVPDSMVSTLRVHVRMHKLKLARQQQRFRA
ncbi:hypothetical protein HBA55_29540 [Pseudomaricurvus alkylphenolicus]|uniref:hypothetical protein n=1 Tax=Pseudomaricurvus alkylphenolicus TaxID=1306991 RepID=UPI001423F08A|nr:hypothetical protein [Pseudomaricurvus alkylphenolicus]NIB43782.1 hypothetical protein [Pseudomaricurvus alkylphenolicus]